MGKGKVNKILLHQRSMTAESILLFTQDFDERGGEQMMLLFARGEARMRANKGLS